MYLRSVALRGLPPQKTSRSPRESRRNRELQGVQNNVAGRITNQLYALWCHRFIIVKFNVIDHGLHMCRIAVFKLESGAKSPVVFLDVDMFGVQEGQIRMTLCDATKSIVFVGVDDSLVDIILSFSSKYLSGIPSNRF